MEFINKIESITERDIDLLLLEEFNVSEEFTNWFYTYITGNYNTLKCKGAWHSIVDAEYGESDLIVIYENNFAVLIENKIDAVAQPEQALRYKKRGEKGIVETKWESYTTCMVAPELYLAKEKDANIYNVTLSYENIAEWFDKQHDKRSIYKSKLINEAIEQNRRGYTVKPDEKVTDFWEQYWMLVMREAPELEMKKPGIKPSNSDWPEFRPSSLNKNLVIVHKLRSGYVDLQISGASNDIEYLQKILHEEDINVVKAGKSAAIRIVVETIEKSNSFFEQRNKVLDGLKAAKKLLKISEKLNIYNKSI